MNFAWTEFGIVVAVLSFATPVASKAIKRDDQTQLGQKFKELSGVSLADMIRGLNGLFIRGFDKLYTGKHFPRTNRFLWHFVFIGIAFNFLLFPLRFLEISDRLVSDNLIFAILGALAITMGIDITTSSKRERRIKIIVTSLAGLSLLLDSRSAFGSLLGGLVAGQVIAKEIVRNTLMCMVIGVGIGAGVITFFSMLGEGTILASLIGVTLSSVIIITYFKYLKQYVIKLFRTTNWWIWDEITFGILTQISLLRLIISFIITFVIMVLIVKDVSSEYMKLIYEGNFALLWLLFLNLFSDSFSVHETRWVLRKTQNSSSKLLGIWLLGDIIFSAILFLIVPLISLTPSNCLQAIIFKGNQPYLGILFWSTFSTSIMFYLFMTITGVMTIFYKPLKWTLGVLLRLNIEKYPIFSLGLVAMMLTPIGFLIESFI